MTERAAAAAAALLALALLAPPARAGHAPEEPPRGRTLEYEGDLRVFLPRGRFNGMAELEAGLDRYPDRDLVQRRRALTLGTYYRLHRNLKAGGFYRVQQGALHDEDWVRADAPGVWRWRDTRRRAEHGAIGDLTARSFVPRAGERLVAELKTRWLVDGFNGQHMLKLRPGLALLCGPRVSLYLRHEWYFPLNYGTRTVYETWAYAGAVARASESVELGVSAALRDRFWGAPRAWREAFPGQDYELRARSLVLGAQAIVRFH